MPTCPRCLNALVESGVRLIVRKFAKPRLCECGCETIYGYIRP